MTAGFFIGMFDQTIGVTKAKYRRLNDKMQCGSINNKYTLLMYIRH